MRLKGCSEGFSIAFIDVPSSVDCSRDATRDSSEKGGLLS